MPAKIVHRDETVSASPWVSPGLVADSETVLRTIIDPDHIKDGKLTVAAVSLDDLRFRGWSVDRRQYTSEWMIRNFHRKWQARKASIRGFFVIPVAVSALRGCLVENVKTFSVIDSALFSKPAHAAMLLSAESTESVARKARVTLMDALPQHVDIASAFNGAGKLGWLLGLSMMCSAPIRHVWGLLPRALTLP